MRPISNKGKLILHGSPLNDAKPLHSRKVTQMTFFGNDHDYKKGLLLKLIAGDFVANMADRSLLDKDLIS